MVTVGMKFDKLAGWYKVVDEVISSKGRYDFAKCHEDDGFIVYVIFCDGISFISTNSLDAGLREFEMWAK